MKTLLFIFLLNVIRIIKTKQEINHKFEEYKNEVREKIMRNSLYCAEYLTELYDSEKFLNFLQDDTKMEVSRLMRSISLQDSPTRFFCDKFKTNINDLPREAQSENIPWSGFYWPIKVGLISARYCNNEKNSIRNPTTGKAFKWIDSISYYRQPQDYLSNVKTDNFEEYVNNYYSPSEKYDLLVGDYNFTLTNKMKQEGNYVVKDEDGDVPEWMGICHGWAPASYLYKAPVKAAKVMAADGKTMIEFLPDDIKALATLFWAETRYKTRFMGGRCKYTDIKEIPSDPETGIWEEDTCYSVNPASFMIVLGNQIEIRRKNLVFDPEINGEIWNQPVYGYRLRYYNLLTDEVHKTPSQSKVLISKVQSLNNKLFNYMISKKDPKSQFYLAVNITVDFVYENFPYHGIKPSRNTNQQISYSFVLELDENENITGGEWLDNFHPNFIWTLDERDLNRKYDEDKMVESFNGSVEDLHKLTNVAIAASENKKVLKAIVDYLVEKSAS